jgi:hypothetical protein
MKIRACNYSGYWVSVVVESGTAMINEPFHGKDEAVDIKNQMLKAIEEIDFFVEQHKG